MQSYKKYTNGGASQQSTESMGEPLVKSQVKEYYKLITTINNG